MSLCLNPVCRHSNPDRLSSCQRCGQPLLLGDRYRTLREIGSGGFGRTYLGVDDTEPDRPPRAIKQFLPASANDTAIASRLFRKEAERLRSLSHPQIPEFLAYFEIENQQYIVQEFIAGQNLAEELAESGVFSEAKIRDLLRQVLPILQDLHDRHLIHRDIKPENLIRRRGDRRLFLVDFGATKLATGTALAQTGTRIGTAEFVAPEQLRGKAVFASDLYSLGVTCIHLLTNTSPFDLVDGDNHWVWRDWLGDNAVSPQLAAVLDRLISPALSHRYPSAKAALQSLDKPIPKSKQNWWKYGGAAVAALAIVAIIKITQNRETVNPNQPIIRETSLEAIEALSSYINIQNDHYLETGKFLEKPSQMIPIASHYFAVQPGENGIQVAAIPRQPDTYGYAAVLWGGKISDSDRDRQQNWKPQDPTDFGTFSLPNFRRTPSEYATRVNYCESLQPTAEPPPLSKIERSLPLSTHELPCPEGYAFSLGIIDAIGKLSATTEPSSLQNR